MAKTSDKFLTQEEFEIHQLEAERDYNIGKFWDRTGHPGSAYFYYEIVRRRYPGTEFATEAAKRMDELKAARTRKQKKTSRRRARPQETPNEKVRRRRLPSDAKRTSAAAACTAAGAAAAPGRRGGTAAGHLAAHGDCATQAIRSCDKLSCAFACRTDFQSVRDSRTDRNPSYRLRRNEELAGDSRMKCKLFGLCALVFGSLLLAGCGSDGHFTILGYTTAPMYDLGIRSVRVPIFGNVTLRKGLEFQSDRGGHPSDSSSKRRTKSGSVTIRRYRVDR